MCPKHYSPDSCSEVFRIDAIRKDPDCSVGNEVSDESCDLFSPFTTEAELSTTEFD